MNREEIEAKVRDFLIEDLEIDEEKIFPEAKLKGYRSRGGTRFRRWRVSP